jgi:hypothetical protein
MGTQWNASPPTTRECAHVPLPADLLFVIRGGIVWEPKLTGCRRGGVLVAWLSFGLNSSMCSITMCGSIAPPPMPRDDAAFIQHTELHQLSPAASRNRGNLLDQDA